MLCRFGNRRLTDSLVAFLQPLQRLQAYVLLFGLRRLLFIKSHQKMGFKATVHVWWLGAAPFLTLLMSTGHTLAAHLAYAAQRNHV